MSQGLKSDPTYLKSNQSLLNSLILPPLMRFPLLTPTLTLQAISLAYSIHSEGRRKAVVVESSSIRLMPPLLSRLTFTTMRLFFHWSDSLSCLRPFFLHTEMRSYTMTYECGLVHQDVLAVSGLRCPRGCAHRLWKDLIHPYMSSVGGIKYLEGNRAYDI